MESAASSVSPAAQPPAVKLPELKITNYELRIEKLEKA